MSDWNDVPNSPQGPGPGTPPPAQPPFGQQPPQQPQQPQQPWGQQPPQQPYGQQTPFGAPQQQFGGGGAPTFTLAPWIKRVGSYVIDAVPPTILYFIGLATGKGAVLGLFVLLAIVFWAWNSVYRQGTTGQSIGKSALGLKLVRESDAQTIGAGLSFGRQLAHFFDGIFYIGYLWPLWDAKRQTFADKICKTVVVEAA